ncbi:hypothetical protein [Methanoculleus chikugoensis]|uniref:DUF4145 domain-containing protein n=1 Tax=Methanoculleus chikugoensis TaxID=118126 RepID=A0ABN5XIN5_9EURY|nr:hypothetical protein [Methanoculleus chikugoensis]BBL68407.1 hypothetical protein MchiMG62_15880 [Methanoculleus chikugoensis]
MKEIEGIEQTINGLETDAIEIERAVIELLRAVELIHKPDPAETLFFAPSNQWSELSDLEQQKQRDTLRKYQRWYTVAHRYVGEYASERVDEFNQCYSGDKHGNYGVIDYIKLERLQWSRNKSRIIDEFWRVFEIQRSILLSVSDVIGIERINLRELISSDFIDREVDGADCLCRTGHPRAAGVLARVALERQLRTLCDRYGLEYRKEDGIEPLMQRLYENDCIDLTQLGTIRHLAEIGEKCGHAGNVTGDEVRASIDRLKELIRQGFPTDPMRPQDTIA